LSLSHKHFFAVAGLPKSITQSLCVELEHRLRKESGKCKGPEIKLIDATLQQLQRYNISIPVEFMMITNGNNTYGWQRSGNDLVLVNKLPIPQ
jgi:type I restriction and modification enzyme subunit R-like protein